LGSWLIAKIRELVDHLGGFALRFERAEAGDFRAAVEAGCKPQFGPRPSALQSTLVAWSARGAPLRFALPIATGLTTS